MLLELKNIRKIFSVQKGFLGRARSFVSAIDGVSLAMAQGENLSLVGESGCGKTTLARIILKLIVPDSGSIHFNGEDITLLSKRRFRAYRKYIQIVFQDPYSSLDPRFTVRNIIKEAMILDKNKYKTEQEKEFRILEILKAVQLEGDILSRFPHEFSGGERQRIAIARALVMNPKLVILDEAVSSLDVLIQEQLIHLLLDLQKKYELTFLFISHNLKVVKKISHRIAVMYKGKIVELASSDEIFKNPLHLYTKELLAAAVDYKAFKRIHEIEINREAHLVDYGQGHFVIGE